MYRLIFFFLAGLAFVFVCPNAGAGWLTRYDVTRQRFVQANEQGQIRAFDLKSIKKQGGS
jgi:hypothetical protein